jgi:hypothetical protein
VSRRPKPLMVQVAERSRARGTARLVLLGYAYFGNPDGTLRLHPTPAGVADRAGVSPRTVERYRPELRKLGELVVVNRDAHGEHVEYAVELPSENPQPGDSERRQNSQQRSPVGGAARAKGNDPEQPGEGNKLPSQRRARPTEDPRSDVDELCELLAELIAENGRPAHLIGWPSDSWRREARLLLDRDGRAPGEAEALVRWSQADGFWRSNILSMGAFRRQYDKLRLRAASGNGRWMSKEERVQAEIVGMLAEAGSARR